VGPRAGRELVEARQHVTCRLLHRRQSVCGVPNARLCGLDLGTMPIIAERYELFALSVTPGRRSSR
jgi:hypothetical protein